MADDTKTLQSNAGEELFLRIWHAEETSTASGTVILSHGLGEHCGRYEHVARFFTARGFAVYGADHVGFGRSGGKRGHVPGGVETCAADLAAVAQFAAREENGPERQILFGHSMGGLFVLRLMLDRPQFAKEAVVTGPALHSGKGGNSFKIFMARVLSRILPALTLDHGFRPEQVCSDPEVVQAYTADPLVHRRLSVELAVSILNEGKAVRTAADRLNPDLSLLLFNGEEDSIADPDVTRTFGQRVSCQKKEVVIPDGMRHEVFNEVDQDLAFQAVARLFDLAPLDSG